MLDYFLAEKGRSICLYCTGGDYLQTGFGSGSVMKEVICPLDVDPRRVVLVRGTSVHGFADASLVERDFSAEALARILRNLGRWARDLITSEEERAVLVPLEVVCEHVECE
jgi:hypothetical protein